MTVSIQVFVNSPVAKCVSLEHELCLRYALRECVVTPDLGEAGPPLKSLASGGAVLADGVFARVASVELRVCVGPTAAAGADKEWLR